MKLQVACGASDTFGFEITSVFLQQISHQIALKICNVKEIEDVCKKFFMFSNKEKPMRNRDTNFAVKRFFFISNSSFGLTLELLSIGQNFSLKVAY